jgi:hypothetical protein
LFANLGIDCLEKNRLRPLDRFAQRSAGTLVFVARLRQRLCAKKYHSLSSEVVVRIQSTIFYLGETSLERGAMVDSGGLGVGALHLHNVARAEDVRTDHYHSTEYRWTR